MRPSKARRNRIMLYVNDVWFQGADRSCSWFNNVSGKSYAES